MRGADRVVHGLRSDRERGFRNRQRRFGRRGDRQGALHHQRREFHVRQCLAFLLRPRTKTCRKRNFRPGQRNQAGRRRAVDGHPQRYRLDRGEQLGRDLCDRHQHLQGGGTHHGLHFAPLHPFPERRESLRHPNLGSAHLHRQSQDLPDHRLCRNGYGFRNRFDRTDGAVRQNTSSPTAGRTRTESW